MFDETQDSGEFNHDDAFEEAANALDGGETVDPLESADDGAGDDTESEIDPADGDGDASAQAAETEQEDDFDLSALPPAAQKRFQELEHKARSDSGRVGALQRQIDEQRQRLEALQLQGKGDSKEAAAIEEKIEELELDPALLDDFPELGSLVKFAKDTHAELVKLRGTVQEKVLTPAQQKAAMEREAQEYEALKTIHPDFEEIDGNPAFAQWINDQPPAVRNLAFSDSAADVSAALTYFKQANPAYKKPANQKQSSAVNRSIDDMVSLPGEGALRSKIAGGDRDALWEHAAQLADSGKL